jgi:thiol:disulfide interchange protein
MDKTTLKDASVIEALGGYVKVKYQVEEPGDAAFRPVLEHFRVTGFPTYVVLRPKS